MEQAVRIWEENRVHGRRGFVWRTTRDRHGVHLQDGNPDDGPRHARRWRRDGRRAGGGVGIPRRGVAQRLVLEPVVGVRASERRGPGVAVGADGRPR